MQPYIPFFEINRFIKKKKKKKSSTKALIISISNLFFFQKLAATCYWGLNFWSCKEVLSLHYSNTCNTYLNIINPETNRNKRGYVKLVHKT